MIGGTGTLSYELAAGWGRLPEGWEFSQVAGVAVDSQDRVYVFHRGAHPVIVFDRDGAVVASWGDGLFTDPHGIFIAPDDSLWLVDRGAHVVLKYTLDGQHLLTIGARGVPAARQSGLPFHLPAGVFQSPSGAIFIADGYGNSRVHVYAAEGTRVRSWGIEGDGPGQFHLPHAVWQGRDGRVYVADRENNRIQIFTATGEYLDQWTGFQRPAHLFMDGEGRIYVAELSHRVSVLAPDGALLARWGGEPSHAPGAFVAPHGIWADAHGDLYVAEVLEGKRLQKFVRRR